MNKGSSIRAATADLTERGAHFDFGKNWAQYSALIDEQRLEAAMQSLKDLVPDLSGKTFLDIGSGSGLFSAAALRLGANRVLAIDIDEESVATTRRIMQTYGDSDRWAAEQLSVFEISPAKFGQFDIVYSWGVLHHTGHMWRAVDSAAAMVAPGGVFAFALYEKTPLCGAWRIEKRLYMRAGTLVQGIARRTYEILFKIARFVSGRGFSKEEIERGMHFEHDVHDWLGGYPYESTNAMDVLEHMHKLGFDRIDERPVKVHLAGLFGTGCSEYVYSRSSPPRPTDASVPALRAPKFSGLADFRRRLEAGYRERRLLALRLIGQRLIRDYRFTWDRIDWWADSGFNRFLDKFHERSRFNTHRRWMLWQLLRLVQDVPGDTAECGVFEGAGSWLICAATEGSRRKHHLFDSFEGLSAPVSADGPYWSQGDLGVSEDVVRHNLRTFEQRLAVHKGWIPERFGDIENTEFAFVHIDVDLYQPTLDSIQFFYPRLAPGAVLLCDDYQSSLCPGATNAIDTFLADKPEKMIALDAGGGFFIRGTKTAPALNPVDIG